eukprot:3276081-Amphidinium_carterae.2
MSPQTETHGRKPYAHATRQIALVSEAGKCKRQAHAYSTKHSTASWLLIADCFRKQKSRAVRRFHFMS